MSTAQAVRAGVQGLPKGEPFTHERLLMHGSRGYRRSDALAPRRQGRDSAACAGGIRSPQEESLRGQRNAGRRRCR